jgi:hypothetical protein
MRLLAAALGVLLVSPMSGPDIERGLALARAREADRQQFHQRYITDLSGPSVAQIEVVTEFRRLVILAEDHVLHGDFMFTRGLRAAEDAMKPTRGLVTIRAQVRFNPLNTFIVSPPYTIALGRANSDVLQPIATDLTPTFSVPFKDRSSKKTLSSLLGCSLEANIETAIVGRTARVVAVTLEGKDVGHTVVDFDRLD